MFQTIYVIFENKTTTFGSHRRNTLYNISATNTFLFSRYLPIKIAIPQWLIWKDLAEQPKCGTQGNGAPQSVNGP